MYSISRGGGFGKVTGWTVTVVKGAGGVVFSSGEEGTGAVGDELGEVVESGEVGESWCILGGGSGLDLSGVKVM